MIHMEKGTKDLHSCGKTKKNLDKIKKAFLWIGLSKAVDTNTQNNSLSTGFQREETFIGYQQLMANFVGKHDVR